MNDVFTSLAQQNIKMYNRGNTIGFITNFDNKKYRLKTLGLEEAFTQIESLSSQSKHKQKDEKSAPSSKQNDDKSQANNDEVERRKAEMETQRSNKKDSGNKQNNNDFER